MFSSGMSLGFIHSGACSLFSNDSYGDNGCECDNDDQFGGANFDYAEGPPKPAYASRSRIAISNLINEVPEPLPTGTVVTRKLDSSRPRLAILKIIEGPATPPISTLPSPQPMRALLNSTALSRQLRMSDHVEVLSRDLHTLETRSESTTKGSTPPSTPSNTAITNSPRSKLQTLAHTTDVSYDVNYASRRRRMNPPWGSAAVAQTPAAPFSIETSEWQAAAKKSDATDAHHGMTRA
ncbi:hypothetical protein V1524DRAFT_441858 [Lipomyces starkeyi]